MGGVIVLVVGLAVLGYALYLVWNEHRDKWGF